LTLQDGTLAGADLDLTTAIAVLTGSVDVPLVDALRAATATPAELIGLDVTLRPNRSKLADLIRISGDLTAAQPLI